MKGLPIHLWCSSDFKDTGDICGGFFELDDNWGGSWEYVRLRIKEGGHAPAVVKVDSDKDLYQVQIIGDMPTILAPHLDSSQSKQSETGVLRLATEEMQMAVQG